MIPWPCDRCKREMHTDFEPTTRAGMVVLRLANQETPCHKCPKIPDDAPAKMRMFAVEPTEKTRKTLRHYRECRAVGHFPDDPLVRRNAALVRSFYDARERQPLTQFLQLISAAQVTGGGRGR